VLFRSTSVEAKIVGLLLLEADGKTDEAKAKYLELKKIILDSPVQNPPVSIPVG